MGKDNAKKHNVSRKSGIIVKGLYDVAVHFSKCCSPVPGDEIVGFVTRGRGVSVHKTTCPNYLASLKDEENRDRWKRVEWTNAPKTEFYAEIEVLALDSTGLLLRVAAAVSEAKVPIFNSSSRRIKNGNAEIRLAVSVTGKEQLGALMAKILKIHDVISVSRIEGGKKDD